MDREEKTNRNTEDRIIRMTRRDLPTKYEVGVGPAKDGETIWIAAEKIEETSYHTPY